MRIGTRGSALALTQARWVAGQLGEGCELVLIRTAGDRGERIGDKERWVSELEAALLDGRIDVAVHSAKDVPGELAAGTVLAAVPTRENARDVLIGAASLDELALGARIGTSSLRRAAQLRAARQDLRIVELRGNVDTRLRKLAEGQCDALVLAAAGLRRLGLADRIDAVLYELVPAAGQGALALQTRSGQEGLVAALAEPQSAQCVEAERTVTRMLGASCSTAVGVHAQFVDGMLEIEAWAGLPDGSQWIADSATAPEVLAGRMIAAGAAELLASSTAEAGR
jgi:hydroxymethylbilane synthase